MTLAERLEEIAALTRVERSARRERDVQIWRARRQGATLQQIADVAGLSAMRVSQIVRRTR